MANLCGHAQPAHARRLCRSCYERCWLAVDKGCATWASLEASGRVAPRHERYASGTAAMIVTRALASAAGEWGVEAVFPWADVVLLAFQADPGRFGLRGYPALADSKAVSVALCRCHKWVERVGTGRYRLTAAGVAAATNGRAA